VIKKSNYKKKALLILHQERSRPGDIGSKLIQRGFSLDIKRPCMGEKLPENMDDHDLAIIFGGPMSSNDCNLEFINYEIEWINVALKSNKPLLGVCLGAQLIAKNLGAKINKHKNDISEIGFFKILPTEFGSDLFKDQKIFFQWHTEGFQLPYECKLLAKGINFQNQAFKYKNSYAIQFHPEVNLGLHLLWLYYVSLYSPHRLRARGAQSIIKQISLRLKYNKPISSWLDYFFDNYLLKTI
tara:strand:+ start:551 stop:1273 length:723 start_codon:yes stop_codon:yes gene_type:complete